MIFKGIYNYCLTASYSLGKKKNNKMPQEWCFEFCCQPFTLAKSKASCLKSAQDFYLLICPAEQAYKNLSNTTGCCCTGELAGKTAAEEGNKPAACPHYQLSPLAIKLAAHTGSSLKNARQVKKVRIVSLRRGAMQDLGQREEQDSWSSCNGGRCNVHRDTRDW